jgi:hypothetical protein
LTEWISGVSRKTDTIGCVTDDSAFSILTARTRTRVFTFLIDASQVIGAFAVANTFWFTVGWRSHKFRKTRT